MTQKITSGDLKEYLLDNLPQKKAERIDLQIISNADFETDLRIAEDTLIEDYLEGLLSEQDKRSFENSFLVSESRRRQVETIFRLKQHAKKLDSHQGGLGFESESGPSVFDRLAQIFAGSPVKAATALIGLIVLIGIAWFLILSPASELNSNELAYAELNSTTDFADLSQFAEPKLVLYGGSSRGSSTRNSLPVGGLGERVLFNLSLPAKSGDDSVYTVELVKNSETLFTQREIRVHRNSVYGELRFFLPSKPLEEGTYQIKVTDNANLGSRFVYSFVIR